MKIKNFVLVTRGDYCFFSTDNLKDESRLFVDKVEGVILLLKMFETGEVEKCQVLELIDDIVALRRFPYAPSVRPDAQLQADLQAMTTIMGLRSRISFLIYIDEAEDGKPVFRVCPGCGRHGSIVAKGSDMQPFFIKDDAIDAANEMFGKGQLDKDGLSKILKEINQSTLPQQRPVDPKLN